MKAPLLLLLALSFAGAGGEVWAEDGAEAPTSSLIESGLVVRFPGVSAGVLRRTLEARQGQDSGLEPDVPWSGLLEADWVPSTTPGLFEPIREYLIPQRLASEAVLDGGCRALVSAGGLRGALARATKAIDFFDFDTAATHLEQAQLSLSCSPTVATSKTLARFLFLEAVAQILQGRPDEGLMTDALGITPEGLEPTAYTATVEAVYALAKEAVRPRVTVTVMGERVGLYELRVDGHPVGTGVATFQAGRHFLQLVSADGRGIAGNLVTLLPEAVDETWPPIGLMQPNADDIRSSLVLAVTTGRMRVSIVSALRQLTRELGRSWVALAVPASGADGLGPDGPVERVHVLWVAPGGVSVLETLSIPREETRPRVGVYLSAALGACAIAAGGASAYTYQQIQTEIYPTRDEAYSVLKQNRQAGVAVVGCASGALFSGGVAFLRARRERRQRRVRGTGIREGVAVDHGQQLWRDLAGGGSLCKTCLFEGKHMRRMPSIVARSSGGNWPSTELLLRWEGQW